MNPQNRSRAGTEAFCRSNYERFIPARETIEAVRLLTGMRGRIALLLLPLSALAQGSEDFRIEVSGYGWLTSVQGTLQSGVFPVDLRSDLDLADRTTFFGRLVVKPGRRHKVVIEGAPYRFSGTNRLNRTVTFNNRTYLIQDTVVSSAELTYFSGGYQFDVVTGDRGFAGLYAGAAYLDGSGTLTSNTAGVTASSNQRVGLPLAGAAFRGWVIPRVVSISGDVKGMALGRYGRFVQGSIRAGAGWRGLTFEAGYQVLDADIHEAGDAAGRTGIAPRIQGPIFGIQIRR
jgi:hypothetical protein